MEWIKNILKKFDRKSCFFYQNNKCIIGYSNCIGCKYTIKKIEGIDNPTDYLQFVSTRRNNRIILGLTIITNIIAFLAMLTALFQNEIKTLLGITTK